MRKFVLILFILSLSLFSCRNNFYNEADFLKVPKIDAHVHINNDRPFFIDQALTDNFRLITINTDEFDSSFVKEQLRYALLAKEKYPKNVFYMATFHFDTAGWDTENWSKKVIFQLDENISGGAISVKIWKNIGMTERDKNGRFIMIDDPEMDPVIDFIESKGLPITGHLGEPRNCWLPINEMTVSNDSGYFAGHPQYHMFLHPEYPSYEDQIKARDHMLEKHPDLIFIGCHLGSLEYNVDSLAKRLDRFPNMAVDMAARICHLQYQSARDLNRVRNFCIKYQDRLLYGTDGETGMSDNPEGFKKRMHNTWVDDWKYFTTDEKMSSDKFRGTFTGLKLPREVINKIYCKNAVKWYKLKI